MPVDDAPPVRSEVPARLPRVSRLTTAAAVWGPGLLVMLADTDAGNIVTAAEAGSRFGYRLLPVVLGLIPVLILVQDLAVRIGIFARTGFGEQVRARLGRIGGAIAAVALVAATLGSLVTELTGIAGVGELYGVSRWLVLPLASLALILVVFTGEYRRVERVALIFGLFELVFFAVAWQSHPDGGQIVTDIADQSFGDPGYLGAGLIGATFNPWMIFYQASAIAEKRLSSVHYPAARWDTVTGAILTQLVTAAVLIALAALYHTGAGGALRGIGDISRVLTPLLGGTLGRAVFGVGVVGASLAAAIVSSLACAWGLGEIFGLQRSLEQASRWRFAYAGSYVIGIVASAAVVLVAGDLVWLSIGMQVLNALLLPVIGAFLVIVAATALPDAARLKGRHLAVTLFGIGIVAIAGLIGAVAGLI